MMADMLHVNLVSVGKLPRGPIQELAHDYQKRLSPYVKLEHRVVEDESKISKLISPEAWVIILDECGQQMTSIDFSRWLTNFEDAGTHLTFVIGGPKGLSEKTKKKARLLLSLSPMTLTHDFTYLLFLEQLNRAVTIAHGKKYHY